MMGSSKPLELAELLKNIKKLSYVNLIPYNPVSEHDQYSRSPKERVGLMIPEKQGVIRSASRKHGTDIDAACGHLRSNTMKRIGRKRLLNMRNLKQGLIDHTAGTNKKRKKAVTEWQLLLILSFCV